MCLMMRSCGTEASCPERKVRAGSRGWGQKKPLADGPASHLDPFLPCPFQLPPGHPFSPSALLLSLFLSCYFLVSNSLLFLLSCALEPCCGRPLSQLPLQSVGLLPPSPVWEEKCDEERGLLEEKAHSLGVRGPGFRPGCLYELLLCASASLGP